jgi:hypothetical protein
MAHPFGRHIGKTTYLGVRIFSREGVTSYLYSPNCREGKFSETRIQLRA